MMELVTESLARDMYDEMLNDIYDVTVIGGSKFYPSQILREMDPIAYQCGFNDYVDSLVESEICVEGLTDDLMETE
jgi:hypothetical protein